MSKPAFPDKKKLVVEEVDYIIDKLTSEFGVSSAYSYIQISAYCMAQLAATQIAEDKQVSSELREFIEVTYPKLLQEHTNLIEEQFTVLNCEGSA